MKRLRSVLKPLQVRLLLLYLLITLSIYGLSQFVGVLEIIRSSSQWFRSREYSDSETSYVLNSFRFDIPTYLLKNDEDVAIELWFDDFVQDYINFNRSIWDEGHFFLLNDKYEIISQHHLNHQNQSVELSDDDRDLFDTEDTNAVNYQASRFNENGSLSYVIRLQSNDESTPYFIFARFKETFSIMDTIKEFINYSLDNTLFGGAFLILAGIIYTIVITHSMNKRFQRLAKASQDWAQGSFDVRIHESSQDEIGQLTQQFNQMAEQLDMLMQERQAFSVIEERNRVARDLHDSIKQQIFAVSMQLSTAHVLVSADDPAYNSLSQAKETIQQVQKELTAFIHQLRPVGLQNKGLVHALQNYGETWQEQHHIDFEFVAESDVNLPLPTEIALFRIAQEALANVFKHSQAKRVTCALRTEDRQIYLSVKDDGIGIDLSHKSDGFGLQSIRERIEALNGRLNIHSSPGYGTEIVVSCPLPKVKLDEKLAEREWKS